LQSNICRQTATASHFPAVCRPFPAPPPKLGYFDMNGDVEVFTQRVTEYLSVTPLHNASGTLAVTVPQHWTAEGLPVGGHFAGRYAEEAFLLRLLGQLESAQPCPEL
jgi:amidase